MEGNTWEKFAVCEQICKKFLTMQQLIECNNEGCKLFEK